MRETKRTLVTVAIFIATFMSAIEGTIISTAMPTIVASLDGLAIMNWVFSIYLLMGAVMTPIYGKLADKYGRKPVFMTGVILFVLGSFSCAMSQSMMFLIFSRFVQGIGAGAILPISMTIIADLYPAEQRANIIGINNASWGIASIVAPMIGGFLVEQLSWHWVFLINVPIGIIVIFLIYFGLQENWQIVDKKPMDLKGTICLTFILLTFLYFFQVSGEEISIQPEYFILLFISLIAMYFFVKIERRAADPIVSLKLFSSKSFMVINLVTFLISGFLISLDVYVPMWLQLLNDESATRSGMALASMSIMWMVGSFCVGKLLKKTSIINILLIGISFLVVSSIIMSCFDIHTAYITFVELGLILGIGFGMSVTTTTIGAQEQVSEDQLGVATSLNTLFRTIGQSIMVALYGMALNIHMMQAAEMYPEVNNDILNQYLNIQTRHNIANDLRDQLKEMIYGGLHSVYIFGLFLIICAFVLVLGLVIYHRINSRYSNSYTIDKE